MDQVEKRLRKLSPSDRARFLAVLERIRAGNLQGLDVRKLQGKKEVFRVRVGEWRIIFSPSSSGEYHVLRFEHRNEKTYRDL